MNKNQAKRALDKLAQMDDLEKRRKEYENQPTEIRARKMEELAKGRESMIEFFNDLRKPEKQAIVSVDLEVDQDYYDIITEILQDDPEMQQRINLSVVSDGSV